MTIPLDLTFRDMTPSESVSAAVQRWVDRLGRLDAGITRCTVVIERPHNSHRHGGAFHVRIELALRDKVVEVSRDPGLTAAHTNVYTAINDAFRAARRSVREAAQIVRTHRARVQ